MLTSEDIKRLTGGTVGTCISALGINTTNITEVESIVSIVCTIIGLIVTLITCLVLPLIRWYKKAKADKKITVDEVEEAVNITKDGLNKISDDIKNAVDKHKEEDQ